MDKSNKIIIAIAILIIITIGLFIITFDSEEPPAVEEGETMQIDSSEYTRYIFVGSSTREYIEVKFAEYMEMDDTAIADDEYFTIEEHENVHILKVPETIDFYTYHNLIGWLNGMTYENDMPKYSVGIAYHNTNDNLGYMCALQDVNPGDTLVGQMRDGRIMTIYLPEAMNDSITFHSDDYDMSSLEAYVEMMREDGLLE